MKPFVDNKIRYLHLDTTYCDTKYTFPKQLRMLGFVENVVCELYQRHGKRILFVIGTHFIGKEKVFLSIFKALKGASKIYVTRHKQRIYGLLDLNVKLKLKSSKNNDDDNDSSDKVNINNDNYNGNKHSSISNSSKIFCTEPNVSQIFAVSMNNITCKYLKELLEINKKSKSKSSKTASTNTPNQYPPIQQPHQQQHQQQPRQQQQQPMPPYGQQPYQQQQRYGAPSQPYHPPPHGQAQSQ